MLPSCTKVTNYLSFDVSVTNLVRVTSQVVESNIFKLVNFMKFYYENVLANQNITAKPNVAWAADITSLELKNNEKLFVFICIDIHTNTVVSYTVRNKAISSSYIVKTLSKTIDKRFPNIPKNKLIIHTDRGSQFSSKQYEQFVKTYNQVITPSMSRQNTPTDNGVIERYMRTLKNHTINAKKLQDRIFDTLITKPTQKSFRPLVKRYIEGLNQKPNLKTKVLELSPEKHDKAAITASMLMSQPLYLKAFSKHIGTDDRRLEIEKYKSDNSEVIGILKEIASRKGEIVNTTPFDSFNDNLALAVIDERITQLYDLIERNPEITKRYVEEAMEPVQETLDTIESGVEELKQLLPKKKGSRQIQPLREPISANLFPLFMENAGNNAKYKKDLKRAQFRVAYTILYYTGLRLNEIRILTQNDIQKAINARQFNIVHFKTKQSHIHILGNQAAKDLKKLERDYQIIFQKHHYKYLFGKNKPSHEKQMIRSINLDLKNTCERFNIPYNIKSHSFRINMISSLLKITSVQHTADIVGHDDIRSTMKYKRYALSRNKIEELLGKIIDDNEQ